MTERKRRTKAPEPGPPVLDWRQALCEALARATGTGEHRAVGLSAVADACVKAAMSGNIQAMKEIAAEFERAAAEAPQKLTIGHTFKSPLSYWDEDQPDGSETKT